MNIWGKILKWSGWSVNITAPQRNKCVICVAPHTSNWDFILGLFAYRSLGRRANFLMKKFWFFFPLKYLLTSLGGIPVVRSGKKGGLTEAIINKFRQSTYLNLAVTPEGTRKAVSLWRTGFLHIAVAAGVPVQLGVIDYSRKIVLIEKEFIPGPDIERDMEFVKTYYAGFKDAARYPDKFDVTTDKSDS